MAMFRIGQRVRVVKAVHDLSIVGKQATIISELQPTYGKNGEDFDLGHLIDIDSYGTRLPSGEQICAPPDFLEPIQYDGNTAISWDICCWQPEHLRESVHEHETA